MPIETETCINIYAGGLSSQQHRHESSFFAFVPNRKHFHDLLNTEEPDLKCGKQNHLDKRIGKCTIFEYSHPKARHDGFKIISQDSGRILAIGVDILIRQDPDGFFKKLDELSPDDMDRTGQKRIIYLRDQYPNMVLFKIPKSGEWSFYRGKDGDSFVPTVEKFREMCMKYLDVTIPDDVSLYHSMIEFGIHQKLEPIINRYADEGKSFDILGHIGRSIGQVMLCPKGLSGQNVLDSEIRAIFGVTIKTIWSKSNPEPIEDGNEITSHEFEDDDMK